MDCVIAGGGIIGLSIAWRLAQRGAEVAVLEAAERPGSEASWAGAGMLAPGGEFEERSTLATAALESLKLYPDFVAELERETGRHIDFRVCGAIEFGEPQRLARRAERQRALGIHTAAESPESLRYEDDALVDPRHVVTALLAALERRGVRVICGARVLALEAVGEGVRVRTGKGDHLTRIAVNAAGAWASSIELPEPAPRSFPVKGHLAGFQLEPGSIGPILRRGHTYVLQRGSGYTIVGASTEHRGFDCTVDPQIVRELHEQAAELAPVLRGRTPDAAWAGLRPATDSGEPAVGRLSDTNVWLAYGHYRNGILLAPHTAAKISSEISSTLGIR